MMADHLVGDNNGRASAIKTTGRRLLILIRPYFVSLFTLISSPLLLSISSIFLSSNNFIKWPLFLFLLCFTHLLTPFIIRSLIFILERALIIKYNKALYFLFGLETSLFYLLSSILHLVSWVLCMNPDVSGTSLNPQFITTTALATFVVGCVIWVFKILILKNLDSGLRHKDYFDNIKHLVDQEYVLQTLLLGTATELYTISDALQKPFNQDEANNLFLRVVNKFCFSESRNIRETDLLRFMKKQDVAEVFKLFEAEETKIISLTYLSDWMVKVRRERKTLVDILINSSMAIKDLNYIVLRNLLALLPIAWFFLMGFGTTTTTLLLSISASWLALFSKASRRITEGMRFLFLMHPFDIGDHCIIDKKKMVIKDVGIYATVVYTVDKGTESVSNSYLVTKSITNLTRSPLINEILEVYLSLKTSAEDIKSLESKIDKFLESKPENWRSGHSLLLKEVSQKKGLKYALQVTHSTKFKNYESDDIQRKELLSQLKQLLEQLQIECSVPLLIE